MMYEFLTKEQYQKLLANGAPEETGKDHVPVVKLFTPDAQASWLLTELIPNVFDIAFGLCDLGLGFPELGYVSLNELAGIRGRLGLSVEQDTHFEGKYPLSVYVKAANLKSCITDDPGTLKYIASSKMKNNLSNPLRPS